MAPRKKKFKSDDVSVAQNVAPADDANVDGSVTDDAIHEDCPENFLIEIEARFLLHRKKCLAFSPKHCYPFGTSNTIIVVH